MQERRHVTLVNRRGLHARAAAKIATMAERFAATLEVRHGNQIVSASSIMGLMLLGAGCGTELTVVGSGVDAAAGVAALAELVTAGFNETD